MEGRGGRSDSAALTSFTCPPACIAKRPRRDYSTDRFSWQRNALQGQRRQRQVGPVVKKLQRSSVRMTSGESLVRTAPRDTGDVQTRGFIPDGAFTITLQVRLRDGVSVPDGKSVLSEYARKTCEEQGVLRCDVLFEVSSRGVAKGNFYEIWVLFEDSAAYAEHEKTSHAAKLRLWLENPQGGDNAVRLTKLSYSSIILEPLRPSLEKWKSGIDYNVEDESKKNERMSDATMNLLRASSPHLTDTLRKSLEVLASNVGLENVTILASTATAISASIMPSLTGMCESYVEEQEQNDDIVRTGILVERNNPLRIFVLTVHDSDSDEGAFFDVDLAADFIDDDGWSVKRYFCVFPDKIGWEQRTDAGGTETDQEEHNFLGPVRSILETDSQTLASPSAQASSSPLSDQQYRLVQGPGAFDAVKRLIREMTNKPTGDVKTMIISGWNASRVGTLLVQMQTVKGQDPGDLLFKFGLAVHSCDASTRRLKEGFLFVQDYRPDVIIGFGGGAVLDMTKALGRFANASEKQLDECIAKINEGARTGAARVAIGVPPSSTPILLIPGNVGPGAEFADLCVLVGEGENGLSRRLCVDFVNPPTSLRPPKEKTILIDSRIISPRRLNGFHAAQGALLIVCRGIEALISLHEYKGTQAVEFAEQAITEASEGIMAALREPQRATGQSRDPLVNAKTRVGIAADCAGRLGVCTRLSLAVVDELVDGASPFCFRMVLIRIAAAVITEICSWDYLDDAKQLLEDLKRTLLVEQNAHIARRLLARAEDADVYTLPELGMVRRHIPSIASRVVKILHEETCSPLEHRFADQVILERILHSARDQEYEL